MTRLMTVTFICACLALVLVYITVNIPDDNLRIVVCDVGQGDAALISYNYTQILIDVGPDSGSSLSCMRSMRPFWDRTIESIIISHIHKDHVGGLEAVLDRFHAVHIWIDPSLFEHELSEDGVTKESLSTLMDRISPHTNIHWGMPYVQNGPLKISSMPRSGVLNSSNHDPVNELAIVPLVRFGKFTMLFTSDIGFPREAALIRSGVLTRGGVMKIPHHGSKYSSSELFIDRLDPSLAVVSVGANSFGHPHPDVISRYVQLGVPVLSTKECGNITITTDGSRYWVNSRCD